MMIYQFAGVGGGTNQGGVCDGIDEISDKHKISLFDDSRCEESMTINNYGSIAQGGGGGGGPQPPMDEYNNSVSKKKPRRKRQGGGKRRILASDNKEHGQDSLYDEQLLDELNKNNEDCVLLDEYRDSV